MNKIFYKSGYKYQLERDCIVQTDIFPFGDITTKYIDLTMDGVLTVKEGYAWDGPSGPTIDTKNFMRGSLVHDACYQLLRNGWLSPEWRKVADMLLRRICLEDGMSRIRAWWVYVGVQVGGGPSADPANARPILEAP